MAVDPNMGPLRLPWMKRIGVALNNWTRHAGVAFSNWNAEHRSAIAFRPS